jgi:DNA-binding XRE family transcriptional regulator
LQQSYGAFNVADYRKRLQTMRMLYGEGQMEFSKRIGIPFKQWNHYERGYPVPRETVWILYEKIPGICPLWLWFGRKDGLGKDLRKRIEQVERQLAQQQLEIAREAASLLRKSKQVRQVKAKKKV